MDEKYKKELEAWQKTHQEIKVPPDKPYHPSQMREKAPLGCIILTILFFCGIVYLIGWASGHWRLPF